VSVYVLEHGGLNVSRVLCPCGAFAKKTFGGFCSEPCRDAKPSATPNACAEAVGYVYDEDDFDAWESLCVMQES
jgi:hypothetical protein